MKEQSRYSTEALMTQVDVFVAAGANGDTAADVVRFQLVLGGLPPRAQPVDDGWVDGYWITTETGLLIAAIQVGPAGAIHAAPGRWAAWINLVDDPDNVVAPFDELRIT